MDEVWKTAAEAVKEKISSPVLLPFGLAWVGWNYKFFVFVFSSVGVPRVFDLIKDEYQPHYGYLCRGFLFPLATAVLVIFVVPWLELGVLTATGEIQRRIVAARRRNIHESTLTVAESQQIRADALKKEETHKLQFAMVERDLASEKDAHTESLNKIRELEGARKDDPFAISYEVSQLLDRFRTAGLPDESIAADELLEVEQGPFKLLLKLGFVKEKRPKDNQLLEESEKRYEITRAGVIRLFGKDAPDTTRRTRL